MSIKQARGMQEPKQQLTQSARVTVEDLRSDRGLPTEVRFDGEAVASLLSHQRIAVDMQMLGPGQTVILNEDKLADGPEGCKWSLSCSPGDDLSVSCTRALGDAPPIHDVRAAFHGCGMTVNCNDLHPDTLKALEYMNAQVLPRAEACRRAVELMKTRALSPHGLEKKKRMSTGWVEVDGYIHSKQQRRDQPHSGPRQRECSQRLPRNIHVDLQATIPCQSSVCHRVPDGTAVPDCRHCVEGHPNAPRRHQNTVQDSGAPNTR